MGRFDQQILVSSCHDPAWNLALEECLIERGKDVIYLWQNEPAVVIGRNQNPYRECALEKLRRDGVHLVRRRSGGGAVYHDLGNLNFTIISQKTPEAAAENFAFVGRVLRRCGICAAVSGRNDLEAEGRKISGSAFFENGRVFCHHGTLLICSQLDRLSEYLTASPLKLQAKGIASVRSRVANLASLHPGLGVKDVVQAFCDECAGGLYTVQPQDLPPENPVERAACRYRSWEWTFGECPRYNIRFEERFAWGTAEMMFYVCCGRIETCSIFTDSIANEDFAALGRALQGAEFKKECIEAVIRQNIRSQEIAADLAAMPKEI